MIAQRCVLPMHAHAIFTRRHSGQQVSTAVVDVAALVAPGRGRGAREDSFPAGPHHET